MSNVVERIDVNEEVLENNYKFCFANIFYDILKLFFCYLIKLDINRFEVNYAEIIYYGDDVEQKIEDKNDLDLLVNTLNKLRFKQHRDMSHLFPKSGVLIVDLYDTNDKCIDHIVFYEWEYRGGEAYGKGRADGIYLKVKNSDDIYDLCDELCGDPFDRLKNKK